MAANGPRTVAAILVAAGAGERLGADVPKAFCIVAGRTLLQHAVTRFAGHERVRDVVVVAPAALLDRAVEQAGSSAVVAGGATRRESVAAGLAALAVDVDAVLVHDVARPFVPVEVIDRVIDALAAAAAVVPVLPVTDTVRRIDLATGDLVETLDRSALVAVQTPQGFRRDALERAHATVEAMGATDDAGLVEALGEQVVSVRGAEEAFKITHPWDLRVAEAMA